MLGIDADQVATTVIKFIPLALMAVVGIIFGLANGMLANNFTCLLYTSPSPRD